MPNGYIQLFSLQFSFLELHLELYLDFSIVVSILQSSECSQTSPSYTANRNYQLQSVMITSQKSVDFCIVKSEDIAESSAPLLGVCIYRSLYVSF